MMGEASAVPRTFLVAILLAAAVGFESSAQAAPENLREGLFGERPSNGRSATAPTVARYVSEEGETFVLDRTQRSPLLKFDSSPEVWALRPQPAPRGDTIYKNDLGEQMLRATRLGGMTLFTDSRPGGTAAALAGGGSPIKLAPMSPQALAERMFQASVRASRAAKRSIPFYGQATPESSALIADAAVVAAEAVVRMSSRPNGRAMLARFTRVLLVAGKRPSAEIEATTLKITVAPPAGLAGRPSSDRIVAIAQAQ